MASRIPIPFLRPSPWAVDWSDDSKLELERYAVVTTVMLGDEEYLQVLSPVLWNCRDAEAALAELRPANPACAIISFASAVDTANPGHEEGAVRFIRNLTGRHGEGVQ